MIEEEKTLIPEMIEEIIITRNKIIKEEIDLIQGKTEKEDIKVDQDRKIKIKIINKLNNNHHNLQFILIGFKM